MPIRLAPLCTNGQPIKSHSYFANWDWHLKNWWRGDFKILSKRHDVRYCCLGAVILFLTFFQIPVSIFWVTYSWLQRMNNCTFSIYQVKSNHWLGNNVFFNYCSAHWNPSKHSTHEPCNVLLKNTRVDRSAASSVETASLTGVLGPFFCFLEGALFTPHHEVYAQGAHAAKTHRRKGKGQGGEFSS